MVSNCQSPLLNNFRTFFYLSNIVDVCSCSLNLRTKIDVRDCVRVFTKHGTSNKLNQIDPKMGQGQVGVVKMLKWAGPRDALVYYDVDKL